jgi:hypothetical protein
VDDDSGDASHCTSVERAVGGWARTADRTSSFVGNESTGDA